MQKLFDTKGYLWARTLFLLLAVVLYWFSHVFKDIYLYGTTFVMAPWAILLVAGSLATGRVRWSKYHILLFAMAGFYMLASLRNGNLTPRGLLVMALGCAMVALAVKVFGSRGDQSPRRKLLIACLVVVTAALVVLLFIVISGFFGFKGGLPWAAKRVAARGARAADNGALLANSQKRTLRGLGPLIFACSAMTVAGIVPSDADAAYLRRESRLLLSSVIILEIVLIAPALSTVFTGAPIMASWMPSALGIQTAGSVTDRISAFLRPNGTGIWAVLGIICAIYVIQAPGRRWLKILLGLCIAIFVMALAHCQSRSSDLALGLGLGMLVFRCIYLKFSNRRWRIPLGLMAGALVLVLVVVLVGGIFTADIILSTRLRASAEPNLLESMRENAASKAASEEPETIYRDDPVEVADGVVVSRAIASGFMNLFSTGRNVIWREGMDYLIHNPMDLIFGMGSGDIIQRFENYNPERYHTHYLHNGYLEVLARGGIGMLVCLIWLLCLLLKPTTRMLVATDGPDPGGYIFPVLIAILLAIPVVESMMFTDATMHNILFFYAAGRVMHSQARQ